jgi:lysophospholipase L1-like esterase
MAGGLRAAVAVLPLLLACSASDDTRGNAQPSTGGAPGSGSGGIHAGAGASAKAGSPGSGGGSSGAAGTGGTAVTTGGAPSSGTGGTGGTAPGGSGGKSGTGGTTIAGSGGAQAGGTAAGGGGTTNAGAGGSLAAGTGGQGLGGKAAAGAGAGGVGGGAGGVSGGTGYNPCPADAACVVLPLGDSITEGCCTQPGGGYRIELFRRAVQNGKNLTFVGSQVNGPSSVAERPFPRNHEGRGAHAIDPGNNQTGISGQITDRALSMYRPHIVLLMIGTNDINGNIDVANAPNRLGALIDDITSGAPDALVVVATIIPIDNTGTNERVKAYNAALPNLVASRVAAGKHVALLDNYAAFARDTNYRTTLLADYLHPNDAGYVVLGEAFYGAISSVLPAAP